MAQEEGQTGQDVSENHGDRLPSDVPQDRGRPFEVEVRKCNVSFFPLLKQLLTRFQKIQQWFHNHGKKGVAKPVVVAPAVFAPKPRRMVVPLTYYQAYSIMFCEPGTPLHKELREAWKLYVAADEVALKEYHHLFPTLHNPDMPWVAFQQVVLRSRISSLTEEELSAVKEFIDATYEKKANIHSCPWLAKRIDDAQSEFDLEREYVAE